MGPGTGRKIIRRADNLSGWTISEIDKDSDRRETEDLQTGWTNMKMISTDWQHLVSSPAGEERLLTMRYSLTNSRRRSSAVGSIDSGGSDMGQQKTRYRVLVMGRERVGKTSIISQFLYDQFSTKYKVLVSRLLKFKPVERIPL